VVAVTYMAGLVATALTLRLEPGDNRFYPAALGLAALWGVGALASGPIPLGAERPRDQSVTRTAVRSLVIGSVLLALFLTGAVAVAHVPTLREPVEDLLDHGRVGSLPAVLAITILNGVVEELFFRGALHAALPAGRTVLWGTLLYAFTTAGTGVPLLVVAAVAIGLVTTLQRHATGGVLGPIITHVTWSVGMLLLLPIVLQISEMS
jgi:membrane protease YdiL (CAAX protease family)